ncbi:MAG: hypothetical protein EAZ84_11585 [Verrucomicrobia bacterium]|nr:MAG: hypothetical protein EAZ84_11585 [Verrucomicrobiota bacterium]TAE88719.1 MAG: hypothetical protein EAZ82_03190 [Verrucomicrobiota bacterium]TAF26521.1 MAG: hypothetical protein EAZ71_04715 [Verrucomicrobiota bacterium]
MKISSIILFCLLPAVLPMVAGATLLGDRLDTVHEELLEGRRAALPTLSDPFGLPDRARLVIEQSGQAGRQVGGWRNEVVGTVFWVGERAGGHNPMANLKSAWDLNWQENFGGYDDPDRREGYLPAGFVPKLNPFYIALPYNDVARAGGHRPEASEVIPWFWREYRGAGISVCKGRWVALHREGKVCYAQWEDVGPFEVDHWAYVFGDEAPRENRNQGAGIDLSPAVRDFLGFRSGERVQWRFVEARDVPIGPWTGWGDELPSS